MILYPLHRLIMGGPFETAEWLYGALGSLIIIPISIAVVGIPLVALSKRIELLSSDRNFTVLSAIAGTLTMFLLVIAMYGEGFSQAPKSFAIWVTISAVLGAVAAAIWRYLKRESLSA
ncbi:hypothetical protein [Qipengyuania sp.]|uniref:hypothetical protein n=1 Tax=Qipengyuania sp. TaxID=2004515 RepID=UPI003BAAE70C